MNSLNDGVKARLLALKPKPSAKGDVARVILRKHKISPLTTAVISRTFLGIPHKFLHNYS